MKFNAFSRAKLFLVSLLLLSFTGYAQDRATVYPSDQIIHLKGSPEEMGKQYGSQVKDEAVTLYRNWMEPRIREIPVLTEFFARYYANKMGRHASLDLQKEIKAFAKAVGLEYTQALMANAASDLMEIGGCSTLVISPERSSTGGMLYGRNLDYEDSDELRSYWRVISFEKTGALKVLAIGLPGVSGVLTGVNEKNVMMSVLVSYSKYTSTDGVPQALLFRQVLEQARTAEEAIELYTKLPRTTPVNVTIADGKNSYVLEVTSGPYNVRKMSSAGTLYAANHFENDKLRDKDHYRDDRWPILASFDRTTEKVDAEALRTTMGKTGWKKGNIMVMYADFSKKQMIFGSDPENRDISANGKLYSLDWEKIFKQ